MRIQQGIQGFDTDIQTAINYKKNEFLKPIYAKIGELVSVVAKKTAILIY